jgi:hypothetical protein
MGGSYKQCTECGKRALSIATRCPGCGREFAAPAVPTKGPALELGRLPSPGVVVGVLAAVAVLTAVRLAGVNRAAEEQSSVVAADSMAAPSEVAYAAALPAESPGELLVARTWTNVRKSRSTGADLEAVLMPGDTVLADSLGRGWYRVALDGEVLGYAHRSTLAAPGTWTERLMARDGRPGI